MSRPRLRSAEDSGSVPVKTSYDLGLRFHLLQWLNTSDVYSRAGESGNYYDNIRRYALGMHLTFAVHLVSDKTGQEFGSGQSLETSWWKALPRPREEPLGLSVRRKNG